jgi:thioesterase domain-containing protein/acyl carrier protein
LNLLRSYDGVAGPEHRIGRVLGGVATMFMNAIKTALLLGETYFFDAWASPPSDIPGWVDRHQLTVLSTVPSVLRTMLASAPAPASLASLDEVWLSGEPTTDQDARDLASVVPPTTVLTSSYASSEAAGMIDFVVTMADVDSGTVPWDTQVDPSRELVIVDRDGVPVPDGQLGEITVFSSSVSLGYWNRPAETAATFRPTTDGRTQVATGDAGVRHPDGRIELHGRVDRMVKVHGVRIELGEIEVALGEIDGVVHAAAVTYERRPGDVRLVAFAVLAPGTSIDGPALRRRLSTRLPRAMLPDGVVVIDELPLLPGGKVDRAALPPFTFTPVTSSVEPSTVLEAALLGVVRAETGIATAGIDDDLFFDLGVDSLAAAGIFAAFADDLDIDQPLTLLLEAPTVRALAAAIEGDAPPSPVTTFRRHGTQPPLIAVQGAYGSVLFARRLLDALDDEQPLYGVELAHDAAIGRIAPPTSLPTLARQHLDLLHAHGLTGPLRLFGYSFGGAVAYEMAWQIEQAGGEVDLLVLGDCPSFGIDDELPRTHRSPFSASMERQRFRALVRSGGARNLVSSLRLQRQRWLGARRRTAELKRHRRHGGTLAPSARDAYLEQVSMDLFSRWRPTGPLRAPGLYLDAARSSCRPPASSLFGGGLGIVSFECDHAGLVDGTTAPAVGQCIADECRRRRSADSSSTGQ